MIINELKLKKKKKILKGINKFIIYMKIIIGKNKK